MLEGGIGNDLYIFEKNWGNDTIKDNGSLDDYDIIQFIDGITSKDIIATKEENNLVLTYQKTQNKLTVTDYFESNNSIEVIRFTDRVVWNKSQVKKLVGY